MSEDIGDFEAALRMKMAVHSFRNWSTDDLWAEYGLLVDEAAEEPVSEENVAKREGLGLALIGRGAATASELHRGWPDPQYKGRA